MSTPFCARRRASSPVSTSECAEARDVEPVLLDLALHHLAAFGEGGLQAVEHRGVMAKRQEVGRRALEVSGGVAEHHGAQRACFADEGL